MNDIDMDKLTDEEKYANYCRLLETIDFIEKGERVTEDWMEDNKHHIQAIRLAFPEGFQNVNPEIKDKEFRKLANETETIMNSLIVSIQYDKTFKVGHYYILLTRILSMFNSVCLHHGDGDQLCEFMNKMTLG